MPGEAGWGAGGEAGGEAGGADDRVLPSASPPCSPGPQRTVLGPGDHWIFMLGRRMELERHNIVIELAGVVIPLVHEPLVNRQHEPVPSMTALRMARVVIGILGQQDDILAMAVLQLPIESIEPCESTSRCPSGFPPDAS